MVDDSIDHLIIISRSEIPHSMFSLLEKLPNTIRIELFYINELLVDITENEMVPQYTLLNQEEINLILDSNKCFINVELKVDKLQLPRMSLSDPIAKYFGCKSGDLLQIIRKSESAGRSISYRVTF